jgi:hypothetical protein
VKYQIYYYNGLTCQQKRGENIESRVRTSYIGKNKEIQLKIRCSQVDVDQPQIWVPGLGYNPPQALVAAAGGFLGIETYARDKLNKFVNDQFKEIIAQAPAVRKIVIIGHSLGGRVVNMLIDKIKNYKPPGLELAKNQWLKNWRKKFIFLTLGSVEKKGGRSLPKEMDFWQVMNVDDLVLNGLFNVSTLRINQIKRIMEGKAANITQNRNMFNNANIKWKPWLSLRKRYVDPGERIIWIKTTATNPDKIHSDYDKRDGLINAVVAYFGNRMAGNNASNSERLAAAQKAVRQMRRGANRAPLTSGNKRQVRAMKTAAIEAKNERIAKRLRQAAARAKTTLGARQKAPNANQGGTNTTSNSRQSVTNRARAALRTAGARIATAGGRVAELQLNLSGYEKVANVWRAAGLGNIGNVTIRNMVHTAGSVKALVGEIGSVKEAMERGFVGEMTLLAKIFSTRVEDAMKNIAKSAAGKQIGKIFARYAAGEIDWSMAMVLLNADDILKLNIRKAGKNLFTPDEIYNWALQDPKSTFYYSTNTKSLGYYVPNFTAGVIRINAEKKREITNYVINKIASEGGLHWLVKRFTSFAAKFGMGVAQEIYIAIGIKKGMEMAKSKMEPLQGPFGIVAQAYLITGSKSVALAVMTLIVVGHMTKTAREELLAKITTNGVAATLRNFARNRENTHLGQVLVTTARVIEKTGEAGRKLQNTARRAAQATRVGMTAAKQTGGRVARAGAGGALSAAKWTESMFDPGAALRGRIEPPTPAQLKAEKNRMEKKRRRQNETRQAEARQSAMRATSALLRQARLRQSGVNDVNIALLQRAGGARPTLGRAKSVQRNSASQSPRRPSRLARASSARAGGAGMSLRAPGPRTETQTAIMREIVAAQPALRNRMREGAFQMARRGGRAAKAVAAGGRALGRTLYPGWLRSNAAARRQVEMQRARQPSKLKNLRARAGNKAKQAILSKI